MTTPEPEPPANPLCPYLLDMVQHAAIILAIAAGFVFLGLWGRSLHRDVTEQIDRIEAQGEVTAANVEELTRFVRRYDAEARAAGSPDAVAGQP